MSDWGDAFDEQCRAEGLEVPEKAGQNRSNSQMDQNEENKGFKSGGIGRGGMFGGPPKAMNAPPPQTSFGATSGTRIGGAFGSQTNGPDGRGAPIGSDDVAGGNVISVSIHRVKPACTVTRGGGFGMNRTLAPNPPTSFKTNHEGGRFGTLAPKSIGGAFSSSSSENSEKPKVGGSFGASQKAEATRSSVGGSFGSLRTTTTSSMSRSSIGGAFGSKSSSSDVVVEVKLPVGGSFGASKSTNTAATPSGTLGGSFGSPKPTSATGSVGGGFGAKPAGFATVGGGFGRATTQGSAVGGAFGSNRPIGGSSQSVTPSDVKQETVNWRRQDPPSTDPSLEVPVKPSSGGVFGSQRTHPDTPAPTASGTFSFPQGIQVTRSNYMTLPPFFGKARGPVPEMPDLSTPPPPIFGGGFGGSSSVDRNSPFGSLAPKLTLTSPPTPRRTVGGGFGFASKENRDPAPTTADDDDPNDVTIKASAFLPEKPKPLGFGMGGRGTFGGRFGGSRDQKTLPQEDDQEDGQNIHAPTNTIETKAPFMGQQAPPSRGGYQAGFRGGRGGQMDFGGSQGHSMGRGRGQPMQPFVPHQRATPPPFNAPTVIPDPKFKYTKAPEENHEQAPIPSDIALLNKFIQKEVKMMKDMVVDVQRQDPKSPLYSISSFRELRLKPEVLQALDALNFQFPTRIQETALPLLLMEPPSNLIAQAQSGTGKTAAFVLTMLCRIDVNLPYPQCICLAPTLELAKQIGEVVENMGRYMENLKIHYAIKGGNMAAMRGRKLNEQIVIGTPGITRDYLQKYKCIDPSKIRCLVLDEADVMIYHQGFTDISTTIYNMVEEASESVQSMLFSATYDEPVINFATKIIKNAIVVMLKREEQALPNIKQFYVQCACRDSKYAAIVNLYSGLAVASSVIFCHTKASVMWLFENMKARGHQVDVLHGDMTVVERADTIIRFKRGDFKVLITTNVFARGIDVAQVSVVINYDLPIKYDDTGSPMIIDGYTQPDCETYLHRIGRTGRFGKTGIAINFIDSEDSMNMINVLENHFQMKITRMDPSNLVELEAIEMA